MTSIYSHKEFREHEQITFFYEEGLRVIIAIHNTSLGPSLGGVRICAYDSEDDALQDVLRLSRGMTYKAAAAGLDLGGGKAVILGDPRTIKTEHALRSFGKFVERLNGRYITSVDIGSTVADLEIIRKETRFVAGLPVEKGGSGDPSPATALGIFYGIKACLKEVFGAASLDGIRVAVQGLGKVGYALTQHLFEAGAQLIVSDPDEKRTSSAHQQFGARVVSVDEILRQEVEVVSPCAIGAILNATTIPKLNCRIVAGGANNQLEEETRDSLLLARREILYAPDFVINGGGLIHVASELQPGGYDKERVTAQIEGIFDVLLRIFDTARSEKISTAAAARALAESRLRSSVAIV